MHRIVLYNEPAVAIVVAFFVLVSELHQEFAEPLADLDYKGNGAIEDVALHLSDDGNGSKLTELGGVVLSLLVMNPRSSKDMMIPSAYVFQLFEN